MWGMHGLHTLLCIKVIETVQHRATGFVYNNFDSYKCVADMATKPGWPTEVYSLRLTARLRIYHQRN